MEQTLLDVNKIHILLATTPIKELMGDLKKEYKYFQMEYNFEDYNFLYEKYAISNRFDGAEVIFFKRMLQTILPEKVRNQIASRIFVRHIGQDETAIARELYMSSDEMERMQRNGMFFGIHGYDHNWLGSVSKDKMEGDLNKALDVMDEFIDRKCWVMNYPYGSYNNNVIDFISKSGCKLGLTTDVGVADISKNNRFMLPRLDTNDMPPISENYLKLDLM